MKEYFFPVHVFAEDTDYGGIVYHANYVKYFDRARTQITQRSGFGLDKLAQQGFYLVIRRIEIDYLRPARLHDDLEINTKVTKFGNTTLTFSQQIYLNDAKKLPICQAEVLVVCVNEQMKPVKLPKEFVEVIRHDS